MYQFICFHHPTNCSCPRLFLHLDIQHFLLICKNFLHVKSFYPLSYFIHCVACASFYTVSDIQVFFHSIISLHMVLCDFFSQCLYFQNVLYYLKTAKYLPIHIFSQFLEFYFSFNVNLPGIHVVMCFEEQMHIYLCFR